MAEKIKNDDNGEIRSAQTNPVEPANASGAASPAQMTIAENDARAGNTNPTNTPGGAATLEAAAKEAGKDAANPAASSTQAGGGAVNVGDKGAAATGTGAPRDKAPLEVQDAKTVASQHEQAAAAGAEMFNVTVDGVAVQVPKGTLAIEACFRAGADVPYFCYHPRLTSVGACRMCIVSIELEQFGARRAANLASCTIPIAQDNVVIQTQTPDVKKAQNGILEFLLANHPLDCPVCDRGGECPLQNMTITYGASTSRFIEEKRHYIKAMPLSDYIVLDRERCIQCMRCTRFSEEIAGDGQLTLINRGANTEIGTFYGQDFSSNFSGNVIKICPVGALTSRSYRFAGRPWEIKSADSICAACGNGCNIAVQTRLGELVRVNARTNEDINEEWTCDRGKFGQYYVNDAERLTTPLLKTDDGFEQITWDEALKLIADQMLATKAEHGADALAAIGSSTATLEENYLLGRMMRGQIGTNNVDYRMQPTPLIPMQTSIADIENFAVIASVGFAALDFDQPIVFLRVQKAVSKNKATWLKAQTVDADIETALRNAGEKAVLLVAHNVAQAQLDTAIALCEATGAKLNVLLPDANSWGAARAGMLPDQLPHGLPVGDAAARSHVERFWNATLPTRTGRTANGFLMEAASGTVQFLYIMGSNPAAKFMDSALAVRALDAVHFVVVSDMFLTDTAKHANIVLPACSFAEKDGTFVNIEGREQKIREALRPKGDSRPDWRILADLMARLGTPVPYFSARDVYREYARILPK
ncbi:MAG: NADH-quinone oxidoreductase subunit NuoG [Armatimonadetes bacterium]|nr:NADH-quinone oxidoreductase subunit NuoG [Armatimonadota bacterium]